MLPILNLEEQIQTYSEARLERISLRVYSRPANSPPQGAVATRSGRVHAHTCMHTHCAKGWDGTV